MSIWSKLTVAVAVSAGFLVFLNHSIPQADSEDDAKPIALRPQLPADRDDSRSAEIAVPDSLSNTTKAFTRMRAALAIAKRRASELTSYTAILEMQEEVNGNLRAMDSIQFKLRQRPFSVYMRWTDNDQEALFVRGKNDDRLLAKPVGGLASLKRLWRLNPDSRLAKQSCRYPITDSGIENLVNRVHEFYAARSDWTSSVNCSVSELSEADHIVTEYCLQFRDKSVSPEYLKSRLCFEESTGLLIVVENFGWTDEESPRIVEHYAYRAIDQTVTLSDSDFDEKNSDYEFVAR